MIVGSAGTPLPRPEFFLFVDAQIILLKDDMEEHRSVDAWGDGKAWTDI